MMDINRNNYESFFMDYLDGRMSPDKVIKLTSFLKENPDLKAELEEFEEITVKSGKKRFESKKSLKKTFIVNDSNFDNFCIAGLEGDLTYEESQLFQRWLQQNPLKAKEFELYKKSRLIPEKITFDFKSTLKKKSGVRIFTPQVWRYISVAASIIILITLYMFIDRPGINKNSVISEKITDTTTTKSISRTDQEPQTKTNINKTNINKENIRFSKPGYKKQQKKTPGSKNSIEKPVIAQDISVEPEKQNRLIQSDTVSMKLKKIRRKEIGTLSEKPIFAALVPAREFKVIENPYTNLTLSQKAIKSFKGEILNEEEEILNPGKFTLWDIADAGIRGINKIIGWNMKFDKEYDNEGELIALAFDSNTISFNHTMNR